MSTEAFRGEKALTELEATGQFGYWQPDPLHGPSPQGTPQGAPTTQAFVIGRPRSLLPLLSPHTSGYVTCLEQSRSKVQPFPLCCISLWGGRKGRSEEGVGSSSAFCPVPWQLCFFTHSTRHQRYPPVTRSCHPRACWDQGPCRPLD